MKLDQGVSEVRPGGSVKLDQGVNVVRPGDQ